MLRELPRVYRPLMNAFWPGALSFLVPLPSGNIAPEVYASLPTLVIRMPSHAVARALIHLVGIPIAAPSANTSGRPSPTTAQHVIDDMLNRHGGNVDWPGLLILDGGPCVVGVESTVIDGLSRKHDGTECLRILRLGGVGPNELEAALKEAGLYIEILVYKRDWDDESLQSRPSTPGMKYRHYAPEAQVVIVNSSIRGNGMSSPMNSLDDLMSFYRNTKPSTESKTVKLGFLLSQPSSLAVLLERYQSLFTEQFLLADLGDTADSHARNVFAGLRSLESRGASVIFVEKPLDFSWDGGIGLAVAERLNKAAGNDGTSMKPSTFNVL